MFGDLHRNTLEGGYRPGPAYVYLQVLVPVSAFRPVLRVYTHIRSVPRQTGGEIIWRGARKLLAKLLAFGRSLNFCRKLWRIRACSNFFSCSKLGRRGRKNGRVALTRCLRQNLVGFGEIFESVCGFLPCFVAALSSRIRRRMCGAVLDHLPTPPVLRLRTAGLR